MEHKEILIVREDGERIDSFIANELKEYSRSRVQQLIKEGMVKVGGTVPRQSYIVKENDCIEVLLPEIKESVLKAENIPLDIVFEDKDMIVVNKSRGMVVHPAPGHREGTLVNALLSYCDDLSGIGGVTRPGIVHRLDKDTSGLIMVAKNDYIHQKLSMLLKNREIRKEYIALVHGHLTHDRMHIKAPLGRDPRNRKKMAVVENGRIASTLVRRFSFLNNATFIGALLETGRTHQIRVHLAYAGHPLIGDSLYGGKTKITNESDWQGHVLHARKLSFNHPRTGKKLSLRAPIPEDFRRLLKKMQDTGDK